MRLAPLQLNRKKVYNNSGIYFGRVTKIETDDQSKFVINFWVAKFFFFAKKLIHSSQVLEVKNRKIIVEDNLQKEVLEFENVLTA